MTDIIHFRTHRKWYRSGVGSTEKIRTRWSEYDTLRTATLYDDARDIAWKQSLKSETLYVKSREDTTDIRVLLWGIGDASWDFSLMWGDDKQTYYRNLEKICETSCRQSHISYKSHYTSDTIGLLVWEYKTKEIERYLIIVVVSSLEIEDYESLATLAKHNDIIVIHLFHVYEFAPEDYPHTLIESSLIDITAYHWALDERKTAIRKELSRNTIWYIESLTKDNPIELLNHYFKHLYAR